MRAPFAALVLGIALLGMRDVTSAQGQGYDHHGPPAAVSSSQEPGRMTSYPAPVVTPYPPAGVLYVYPPVPPPIYAPAIATRTWDIRVYDNYYSPSYLFVPSGTTIRWTNHGKHHHTVTAFGVWDSGDISPNGVFGIQLTYPGTYAYHCRFHPREMYGRIIVY